jgi:hypothetical protein
MLWATMAPMVNVVSATITTIGLRCGPDITFARSKAT